MKDEARYHHSSERSRNQISGCPVVTPEKRGYCDEDCQVLTSLFWTHTKNPLILRTCELAEKRQKKWWIFQCQELSWYKRMSMLWFYFILGSNFIFLCFKLVIIHYNTQKQKKTKFEPKINWTTTSMSIIWQLGKIYNFIWTVQLHPPALMSL